MIGLIGVGNRETLSKDADDLYASLGNSWEQNIQDKVIQATTW
ncbi:hypothetical protein [Fastidiosibacter lacustris]|nr:hypothetical protein [Fastidiosibacter lacustris]